MKSVVSAKGQGTIPKPLRDRFGLRSGTELEFVEEHGHLVGRRIVKSAAVTEMRGPGWRADLDGSDRDHGR